MYLDKFYTKPEAAQQCIDVLLKYTEGVDCCFVEPSAGSGAFIREFTNLAYDLAPEAENIIKQDWFTVKVNTNLPIVVYGNPPFGSRNTLTKSFIKHAIDMGAKVIAFVLPSVFNKHTLQKVFPKEWKLAESLELGYNSFTAGGEDYNIPAVFQVWIKNAWVSPEHPCLRAIERKVFNNKHFSIVKEGGDLFVMGAAPKTVKYPENVSCNNRGYWLQCHISVEDVKRNLEKATWKGFSSASGGVAWLTKTEFMNTYEENYDESK